MLNITYLIFINYIIDEYLGLRNQNIIGYQSIQSYLLYKVS